MLSKETLLSTPGRCSMLYQSEYFEIDQQVAYSSDSRSISAESYDENSSDFDYFIIGMEEYILRRLKQMLVGIDQSSGSSALSQQGYRTFTKVYLGYHVNTVYDWGQLIYHPVRALEQRFAQLADEWRNSQGVTSSLTQLVMHPSYQQIIAMGRSAIPLIFRELEREPNHWFWALKSITGVDPVSDENRGNIQKMSIEWLDWGREQGYYW